MTKNIVAVIVAHPDDEILAFGGTMARHSDVNHPVHVLIMATGIAARSSHVQVNARELRALRDQAAAASEIIGVDSLTFRDFPDNRMDSVDLLAVVKEIENFLAEKKPSTVYTHHMGDLNIDHQIVSRAVMTACRPLPGTPITTLLAGEAISSTEWSPATQRFIPTEYVDISTVLERKLKALECYAEELRDWPHPRSLRGVSAVAQARGTESGVTAAEAFSTLRRVREIL